jgi:hypothetical protein
MIEKLTTVLRTLSANWANANLYRAARVEDMPERIWIQPSRDMSGDLFGDGGGMPWSAERHSHHDVEYIRLDVVTRMASQITTQ